MQPDAPACTPAVTRYADYDQPALAALLARFGLGLESAPDGEAIPGSYWGDEEAGLVGNRLIARGDTPVHSILHEACHFICMDRERRSALHTDASGDYDEENAVCYLQILLADTLPDFGRNRMFRDMDAWEYSFRLGSAQAWFEQDAEDAREWLCRHGLLTADGKPAFRVRES